MNTQVSVEPRTVSMSTAQLQMLLRAAGTQGSLSPVRDLPAASPASDDSTTLREAGILDEAGAPTASWMPAAAALAAPALQVVVTAGGPAGLSRLQAFASDETNGRLVSFVERGAGEWMVAWPLAEDDIAAIMTAQLALDSATNDPDVQLELTPEGFLMLGAVLDALREEELESLLARDRTPAPLLKAAAVRVAMGAGLTSEDYRWLVPIFRRLLPNVPEMNQGAIDKGLADLVSASIIEAGPDREYGLVAAFEPVRRLLLAPLAWSTLTTISEANLQATWNQLGGMRTFVGLWGVEARANGVRLGTLGEAVLLQAFRSLVTDALAAIPAGKQGEQASRRATASANMAGSTAGSEVNAARRFCQQCGRPVGTADRFCGECGAGLA
ncbi:zinc ribbon domain-containing protein [Bradyrhizobium sp.]|uniref:zinc ribbon domain-containing protein n=1 Tax=Bradyrhizobium sp. TaxID=376 RepID=UPI00271DCC2A|nr:zinc ribbon domain-containing protein [Bradyrhizobium sp.]MDO9299298.1 zinc ribbon domain-containing protein [Bradyrhizobium sp.]